jgi:curved DNA-binding protein CbpA
MNNRRNYYRILHVQPDAPLAVIKASYRSLLQKLKIHPDLGGDHWNATLVNEAYNTLKDDKKRQHYDKTLLQQVMGEMYIGREPDDIHNIQKIRAYCAFCKTPYVDFRQTCGDCDSPLTSDEVEQSSEVRRQIQRMPKSGPVYFFEYWPQAKAYLGELQDLSPEGMCFLTDRPLEVDQILKIDGEACQATAKVAHSTFCVDKLYAVGVLFERVQFNRQQGTFLNTQA